ncbi:MAG: sugar phosphate nucleotidyltransferase [Candidatus Sumerlaeota bacterium]|nr:sugar phosphate nucleotidyltransferase [Candidatus Sumerlaeota bacterium]
MKPSLLILAAGMGSRYGGLKQIDPVGPNGEIIIDYSIHDALRAGFGKLVFVIRHYFEDAFKAKIGRKFDKAVETAYAYQELNAGLNEFPLPDEREKPWGTGHGILMGKDLIREPFAVINADDYYGPRSFQILHDYLAASDPKRGAEEYAMIGFILRNTLSEYGHVARGVCECNAGGWLRKVTERTKIIKVEKPGEPVSARFTDAHGAEQALTGGEIASMNLWGFQPSVFPHLERMFQEFLRTRGHDNKAEFFIPTAVDILINTGQARIKVLPTPDRWFGVTYRPDRDIAEERIKMLIEQGVYPEILWGGRLLEELAEAKA